MPSTKKPVVDEAALGLGDAIFNQNAAALRRALAKGASVDGRNGFRPLCRAVADGYEAGARILLEAGANARLATAASESMRSAADGFYGLTPLMIAARKGNNARMVEMLLPGSDVEATDPKSGKSALFFAVESVGPQALECLRMLAQASDLSRRDANGDTAWMAARKAGNAPAAKALAEQMAPFEEAALKKSIESDGGGDPARAPAPPKAARRL